MEGFGTHRAAEKASDGEWVGENEGMKVHLIDGTYELFRQHFEIGRAHV